MSKGPNQNPTQASVSSEQPHFSSEQGLTPLEKQSYALQQQALRIAHAMQTSLDAYYLIKRFADEIKALLDHSSFSYNHEESEHHYEEGKIQPHSLHYDLSIGEETLGHIDITRETPFTQRELEAFENAVAHLVYPLRNSIKYHEAVIHSLTDPLTRLGNRLAYNNAIAREFEYAVRHHSPLTLVVCDIDKFKSINDTYGHCAGDKVIIEMGQLLKKACRDSDIVFRIGGEEFVILLGHTETQGAQTLTQRLLKDIQNHDFIWDDKELTVTLSLGIACYQEKDTITSLFHRADQALYLSKKAGGNQVKAL